MSTIVPVILCGGSGTRLWPLSRSDRPKQLITLLGDHSLLEETLLRVQAIAGSVEPICVTAEDHGAAVRQALQRLGLRGRLLLEPEGRNTAPALAAAALVAFRRDSDAILVALPADHVIDDAAGFAASIGFASAAAEKDWLVILGVKPRNASSALGYIMPGPAIDGVLHVARVDRFVEKPALEAAQNLLDAGALWNAGIVVARAKAAIEALRQHAPALLEAVDRSLDIGDGEADTISLEARAFAAAPNISFDNAVLERHGAVAMTELASPWRDVGTWTEVAELHPADSAGNRSHGNVHLASSRGTFVFSPHRLTVGIGLADLIVVDTPDVLLIANRDDVGRVRDVAAAVIALPVPEGASSNGDAGSRRIEIAAGAERKYRPNGRAACYWIVLRGAVSLTIAGKTSAYGAHECFRIPAETAYAIGNAGPELAQLIEVQVIE